MGLFRGDFYSDSLKMTTGVQVIFPENSNDVTPVISGTPRVLYLLHGLSGSCVEWTRFSKIEYYAKMLSSENTALTVGSFSNSMLSKIVSLVNSITLPEWLMMCMAS